MDGLFFLLSIVAIALLMRWVAQNDRVPADEPTRGLFAMTEESGQRRKRPGNLPPSLPPSTRRPPSDWPPPS